MNDGEDALGAYANFVERQGRLVRAGGILWALENRRLTPITPPHRVASVDTADLRNAMRRSGALLAMWNEGWDLRSGTWWWICCDDADYNIEKLEASRRKSVRRALRNCSVRRLPARWFAEHGYDVYAEAHARYSDLHPVSRSAFQSNALANATYAGRETWGAFVGDTLAAYASCIVIGDMVNISAAKSVPVLLKHRPNDALHYTLRRHYLVERGLRYLTDGSRVLEHDTHVQDFYESMGSRRIYCRLRLLCHPFLQTALFLKVPWLAKRMDLQRWRPHLARRMASLDMAHRISRESCKP